MIKKCLSKVGIKLLKISRARIVFCVPYFLNQVHFGWSATGFLKLLLSMMSVCVCMCPPGAINN